MAKRRITKASKRRLTLFGTISVIAVVYFSVSLVFNAYTIYNLSVEKKELEERFLALKEEAKELKLDIEKLNDEKYLADYARENYLYSKDNEYIIQIEEIVETKEEIDTISTVIDKNYILLVLGILIVLIFIYILTKGKKNNKKK